MLVPLRRWLSVPHMSRCGAGLSLLIALAVLLQLAAGVGRILPGSRGAGNHPLGLAICPGGRPAYFLRWLLLRIPGDLPGGGGTDPVASAHACGRRRGLRRFFRPRQRRAGPVRPRGGGRGQARCSGACHRTGGPGTRGAGRRRLRGRDSGTRIRVRPAADRRHGSLGGYPRSRLPGRLLGRRTIQGQVPRPRGLARGTGGVPGFGISHPGVVLAPAPLGLGSARHGAVLGRRGLRGLGRSRRPRSENERGRADRRFRDRDGVHPAHGAARRRRRPDPGAATGPVVQRRLARGRGGRRVYLPGPVPVATDACRADPAADPAGDGKAARAPCR